MRWTLVRAFALWILFVLSIACAVFIGRQQPAPERVALLHLNDCELPCWIGIMPGKTTLAEAQTRVRQVYGNISGYQLQDADDGFLLTNQTIDDAIQIRFQKFEKVGTQWFFNEIDIWQYNPTGGADTHLPAIADLYVSLKSPWFIALK